MPAPSPLDALKPQAQVDYSPPTAFRAWAAAVDALDRQARDAAAEGDWEHVWIWSRKAAAITAHLAGEHADRSKADNRDLLRPLLKLVTSEEFKTRIKTAESLLLSRAASASGSSSHSASNGAPAMPLPPVTSSAPDPPLSPPPPSIKERMAALRGAGLNTGGDGPVASPKRASGHFGPPKPQQQQQGTGENAMVREASNDSPRSVGRASGNSVVERLERLAMDAAAPPAAAPGSPKQSAAQVPTRAPLPSSVPLVPKQTPLVPQAPPPAPAPPPPPQQQQQPEIEVSSPSPIPEPAPAPPPPPPPSSEAQDLAALSSAVSSRSAHGYSASVPSLRSGSPPPPATSAPLTPTKLVLAPLSLPSASAPETSASAPPALEAQQLELGSPLETDEAEFSPSKFGHFPSITEFESANGGLGAQQRDDDDDDKDLIPALPNLPSVPLALPGAPPATPAPKKARPLPDPPAGAASRGLGSAHTTGGSVSSAGSAHAAASAAAAARALPPPSAPPQATAPSPTRAGPVEFPLSNTIYPAELRHYLTLPVELLLLDVRPPADWVARITPPSTGGGQVDCVCIPPALLALGPALSSQQLADALPRTSPFHMRHLYDLVVVYDRASAGWAAPDAAAARAVNGAVYEREFGRGMLKRPPALLVGGWEAWLASAPGQEQGDDKTGAKTVEAGAGGGGLSNGYGQAAPAAVAAAKPSYSPLIPPIASSQPSRPTSHSLLGNGNGFPAFPPRAAPDMPARPSSSSSATAPGTSSSSASFGPTAPMAMPPAPASLARSSARRRSEYVEQTGAYTGYPGSYSSSPTAAAGGLNGMRQQPPVRGESIDYPILSPSSLPQQHQQQQQHAQARPPPPPAHRKSSMSISHPPASVQSALPQPPPVAATPSLERHASRGALVRSGSIGFPTLSEEGKLVQSGGNEVAYWGDEIVGLSGLKNLGNTCYQNSTLQCLSATEPFSTFFRDGRWKRAVNFNNTLGTKGNLASAYSSLISALWQQEYHFIQPLSFRKSIVKFAPTFDGVDQHDSQEFLAFLLDGLHEDLNRVLIRPDPVPMTPAREAELNTLPAQVAGEKEWQIYKRRNDSLVVDLFQGQYRSRVECLTCHSASTTYDAFMYLSLPVPTSRLKHKVSLTHCLDTFVKEEVMEKADAWNCPKCKKPRAASKSLTLSRLPPVLLIHLKRFSSKNGVFWDKAETLVEFPIKSLDLTKYMPPPLSKDAAPDPKGAQDPRTQTPPYLYELYAVSNHSGSLTTGHYTAYVKSSKRHWKYCDDRTISDADEKEVVSKHAYILFYRRVQHR